MDRKPRRTKYICDKCGNEFPTSAIIDGKVRKLGARRFCLDCSPFGSNNVRDLTQYIPGKRKCSICKEIKDEIDFYTAGNHYLSSHCKECSVKHTKQRTKQKKKQCIDYLGGKCLGCNATTETLNINAFSFHHRDPKEKSFEICRHLNLKWSTLKNELDKCDLLCLNCHVTKYDEEI